ncbi:MAG: Mrp/NBP35 family ATP-binding protein [Clostridia bacterium]|nr:Mrp/NBP35 family ATP-binding protein [Clostridia bacterium]
MSECTHDCSSCSQNCSDRKESLIKETNKNSNVKKVIGIVSGKGGVGKSLVTSLLASATAKAGKKAAILDADLTGPSIPKAFGIHQRATADDDGLIPAESLGGIKVMSLNLLLENESDPIVWRGPVIAGTVQQFWTEVNWGEVDYMYVDMPPGTGDVPLTVFQSLPVDGIIIVTSPQELVTMIVEKAVKMARLMNIPILGLVENMSYYTCPDCGKEHSIFGESHVEETAKAFDIPSFARLPIDPALAKLVDAGHVEQYPTAALNALVDTILG